MEKIKIKDKKIILIGTAHISRKSIEEVEETIKKELPDTIGIELDFERFLQIKKKKVFSEQTIDKMIKQGNSYLLLLNFLLSIIQRKMGLKIGVEPGSEMIKAIELAEKNNLKLELLDRSIKITLKRALSQMNLIEKLKLLASILIGLIEPKQLKELTEKEIEKMKEKDVVTELMKELSKHAPRMKRALVDERDEFIANRLIESNAKKIVAVVGAGHVQGIIKQLKKKRRRSNKKLLEMPKARINWLKVIKYGLPISIILILLSGLYFKGLQSFLNVFFIWFIVNGILSALFAGIARGHPISILTAFIVSPFTSLHPMIAAGWLTGLVELRLRMPKVKDLEELSKLNSVSQLQKNKITHIILVIALTNLGSTIGTLIGLPFVLSLLA